MIKHGRRWERTYLGRNLHADSGSGMSSDESFPPTSEDSDEEHIPTLSSSSEKQNFRSGWRTACTPDYKRKRPPVQFTEHTGCTQDCSKFSPIQIFQLYICQAVWELMVDETNRYAAQILSTNTANQPSAWTPTNVPEMMAFVALLLYPWASTKDLNTACIGPRPKSCEVPCMYYSSTMARNRFTAIIRFLHLANNQAEVDQPPPWETFQSSPSTGHCSAILPSDRYRPGRNLAPDETMVKFSGRIGFKQYMPRKAAKWGSKYFSLNESETGYTCAWNLFTGSQPMSPPSETTIAYAPSTQSSCTMQSSLGSTERTRT